MNRISTKIHFLSTQDGGRMQPIPLMVFRCPVFFKDIDALSNHGYDCRILVPEHGAPISPGETVDHLILMFLSQDEVIPYIQKGTQFTLWEGKTIAYGEVL